MGRGPVGPWYRRGRGWYYTERGKAYPLRIHKDASKRDWRPTPDQLRALFKIGFESVNVAVQHLNDEGCHFVAWFKNK